MPSVAGVVACDDGRRGRTWSVLMMGLKVSEWLRLKQQLFLMTKESKLLYLLGLEIMSSELSRVVGPFSIAKQRGQWMVKGRSTRERYDGEKLRWTCHRHVLGE
jgi:hypothetical protein